MATKQDILNLAYELSDGDQDGLRVMDIEDAACELLNLDRDKDSEELEYVTTQVLALM